MKTEGFLARQSHRLTKIEPELWTGEGPPPVGTFCVLRVKRNTPEGGWMDAEILYSSKTAVVWRWEGRKEEFGAEWPEVEFSPLRTSEQIAAEERKALIKEAVDLIAVSVAPYNESLPCSVAMRAVVEAMIDANYRKQVAP